LGGNSDFHKHDIIASFYFPLFWKFAVGLKSQMGMVAGYGDKAVSFSELYTPGGVNFFEGTMVRGYVEQSIGPRNISNTPTGGHSQLLMNMEISIPLVKNQFYGLLFADAGNAWTNLSETSFFDLKRSVGFGVRIIAPVVGIMGFDFAWGIDRSRVDGAPTQMMTHFQFGPQFF
jgi:outer membrane protein insertion porin family